MRIAIIGAMKPEVDAIVATMAQAKENITSKIRFIEGKIANKDVVVMQSGIGKTASALSTTVLMEHYEIDGVVNIGTAGGFLMDQNVLDVVVGTMVAHHDLDVVDWAKGFGNERFCYKADAKYIDCIREVIEQQDQTHRVWLGPIASGDMFVHTQHQIDTILKYYPEALCAEMEAGSIAQVCAHYAKPFVVVRSLSDITLKKDNGLTFEEYLEKASARSALWCEKFLEALNT